MEPIGCAHIEMCDKEICSHEANKPQICRDDIPVQAQRPAANLDPVRANVSDQRPSCRRIPSYLGSVFCYIQAFNWLNEGNLLYGGQSALLSRLWGRTESDTTEAT